MMTYVERKFRGKSTVVSDLYLCPYFITIKIVVRAEILPRDFLQTPGNYYL